MDVFTAAPHHDVLMLVVQVATLLIFARACGFVARSWGQPAVAGEILAGVILGPSFLSTLIPAVGYWVIPQNEVQGYLLEVIGLLGAMFLLIITGLETDLPLIRRHAKTALGVASGGLILPFASGFLLAFYLPDFLLAAPDRRLVFSLFVATSMSVSAIPVVAKVLIDLKLMRRDLGQTIMAAGMIDDTVAWTLLSVVLGLTSGGVVTAGTVLFSAGKILAFMLLSFTLGRFLLKHALDFMQDRVVGPDRLLSLVVAAAFVWGAIAQAIEIEAVLGAFVVGILFGTMRRLPNDVVHKLESVAIGIFAPVFFAIAGLKVDLPSLLTPELFGITLLVLAVAVLGKMVGVYLGGRLIGLEHWRLLAYGSALNARGAVGIIIATIGLSLGILGQEMYSVLVLMAVATSLMAPALLRWTLQHVVPDEQEARRLQLEELARESSLARVKRVLLPVRQREGPNRFNLQRIETHLIEKLGNNLALTLFTVTPEGSRAKALAFLNDMSQLFTHAEVSNKVTESSRPADEILHEAQKDYDLIILGASEKTGGSETLFNPLTDQLVQLAPCPTMIIKGTQVTEHWPPRRILVPTNGSASARSAAEVAFSLAQAEQVQVTLLNVIESEKRGDYRFDSSERSRDRQLSNAHQIVESLRRLGESQGVRVETRVLIGGSPEGAILEVAKDFDLIVLGTGARPRLERIFLGSRVESVLDAASCPVIVVNAA